MKFRSNEARVGPRFDQNFTSAYKRMMRIQPVQNQDIALDRSSAGKHVGLRVARTRVELRREQPWEDDDVEVGDLSRERHYSVAELGRKWNLSEKTIRRMFVNEPGVLQWGKMEARSRRAYVTLRIPETVALRVHRRLRVAG